MSRRRRQGLVALAIAIAVGATLVVGVFATGSSVSQAKLGDGEMPTALGAHLAKLSKAAPGRELPEGPGVADSIAFANKAYPASDISLASIQAERAAWAAVKGRAFPTGKGRPGTWVSVGPSDALYPATPLRNVFGYVPTDYLAGGRTTVLAIGSTCKPGDCRLYAGVAGGGVWRTKNALSGQPNWEFLSGSFGIQAVSSIAIDPNDPSGNTLWVGTGEANASGDSAAGVGIYKSTDGGDTWTGPLGVSAFNARAVGTIAVKPGDKNTIYAGSTRAVRGVASVSGGGVSIIPGAPRWGLYKSTDGGQTWSFIHNGAATPGVCVGDVSEALNGATCSPRGVRRIAIDPSNPDTVYAGSYARGVWRSTDGGATWSQIKLSLNSAQGTTRPEIAVTKLPNGKTRMYVHEGNIGAPASALFRSDDVATGSPTFMNLSSGNVADAGYATYNVCTGQCWYDMFVHTPPGYPDVVYAGGSYAYGEQFSNKRGVVMSTDAGVTATDMTMDATSFGFPNALHPDQHFLVTNPSNPMQFFEANDGGIMRSSGTFSNASAYCAPRQAIVGAFSAAQLARCEQLLSRVPSKLESMNKGLPTLQFQSLSVSPHNSNLLQGGTQDNGTWESSGNPTRWINTMIGDGGQSGFDAANTQFRFHTFFNSTPDVNFSGGAMEDWNWISDRIYATEPQAFYVPIISDPVRSGWMFQGGAHVWRTKTHGRGTTGQSWTVDQLRQYCNEWTGSFEFYCGDWEPLGASGYAPPAAPFDAGGTFVPMTAPSASTRLTTSGALYGASRSGGNITAVERAPSNTTTLWAATSAGRVFVSSNADAEPASAVTFDRIDDGATNSPGRFVASIYVDPANANRAWIAYSGFDLSTPTTPGHIFEVTYSPGTGAATWVDRSYDMGDIPATDVAYDDVTGDLYASNDFGVMRLAAGASSWTAAAPGMPNVEVAGLTIVPKARILYAATHGLSAWRLNLP